jgi:hypothetical protein
MADGGGTMSSSGGSSLSDCRQRKKISQVRPDFAVLLRQTRRLPMVIDKNQE